MRRREFITLLGGAATAWPRAARAQQPNQVKRIGWLGTDEKDPLAQAIARTFDQEMARLGWSEGQNIRVDRRGASGDDKRIRGFVAELVGKVPDVILVQGTQATAILKQQTSTIPIVFVNVADPVASGFVASFAHPAGNITGFTSVEYSIAGKWISILKDIAPGVTRTMVLYYPDNSNWAGYLRSIEAAAPALSVNVNAAGAVTSDEIVRQIEAFARKPGGGMVVLPGGLMGVNREKIAALAVRHRMPAIYPYGYFATSGGLASYGSDTVGLYRRAASYVDRILKGEKSGDLPVQAPTKFEFVINLKTAKALGLEIPPNVLALADEVIE
jgi:putative tryptophan/tyrosine transport system substrate-binding protein